ncbi:MAG: TMEM175 family protein [Bacteroidota bacterium]
MNVNEEQELKKEFQLERVILFSDAVFAIIITIMVIELKFPESIREMLSKSSKLTVQMKDEALNHAIKEVIFKFTGYIVTFFLVARFWMNHLKIFSFLKDYDTNLLGLNLFFLFSVSIFPFGVTLITGTFPQASRAYGWGMSAYITIFFLSTLAQSLLIRYLVKHKERLCFSPDSIEMVLKWRATKFMLVSLAFFFIVLILANYFNLEPTLFIYVIVLFGIANGIVARRFYPNAPGNDKPFILRMFKRRQKKSRVAVVPPGDE